MRRLILDTNLYIDWFNTGAHAPLLFQPDAVKMMSIVVMMELLAGAHADRDRTRLRDLFRTFRKLGRLLVPSAEVHEKASGVLRQLQAVHGYRLRYAHSLTNDVLIALSARAVGGPSSLRINGTFSPSSPSVPSNSVCSERCRPVVSYGGA